MCREKKRHEVDTGCWGLSAWATAAPPAFKQFSCSARTVWARKPPFWLELVPSGNSQPKSGLPDEFTISPTNLSHPTSSVTFANYPQLHCPHWCRAWKRLGSKSLACCTFRASSNCVSLKLLFRWIQIMWAQWPAGTIRGREICLGLNVLWEKSSK